MSISTLFHHRWAAPVLAELNRSRGSRFVTLSNRLGLSRESLRRTLTALVDAGLVTKNPGYGHPLRPEYVLTERGRAVAPACARLLAALERLGANEVGLKKWSMPALLALAPGECRFSELRKRLPEVTPRALSLALKDLDAVGLVERQVTGDYPPATIYRLRRRAEPLAGTLSGLAA
ncbi:MAG: winged helix-turn-helix transcriptional regulator [Gaiellaceae bacterium]